ncbi:efflux RND transporter periplasmic adaptor subunit [Chitinophaga vietnamensis]|uniref:efflux RND transporter periplasmic adaptor subunit n=1 Tax=Chitinophaga vietnamensis TaxID=2593957 RepID=UPI0013757676|nr:efflux RND transporter periplasmic adaptor subunit [Chitinophaga vietnamensis]
MKHPYKLAPLLLLLAACHQSTSPPAAQANAKDTIAVFLLKADTVRKNTELPAELIPLEQADLSAKVPGYVKEIKVDIGDHVSKGQLLVLLDAPEVRSRYAESEAGLQSAKARWASSTDNYERLLRASQANTPGIVAPVDLQRSRNQMLADSAAYLAAVRQSQSYNDISGYLTLRAPFDGVVTARKADPGALVGPGATILTVQNNRTLRVRVPVPEIYAGTAAISKEITFRVDAYPTKLFHAAPARKTAAIDPVTRTELWEFRYDNAAQELKAGAFAFVKLRMERPEPSMMAPFSAVATTQERRFVIRVKDNQLQWIDIRQGMTNDNGIEIFGDLHPGDTLVVKASDERKPGSSGYWKLQ